MHIATPELLRDETYAHEQGYAGVCERLYTSDHPDVTKWTAFFEDRIESKRIFAHFVASAPRSVARARAVGTQWYRFSAFMPWFLCRAAAQVSNNVLRHYVIQTAFEELGMRDVEEIHPEMFKDTALRCGLDESDFQMYADHAATTRRLDSLRTALMTADCDATILGLLLGLELPAEDNIRTVFMSLAHDAKLDEEMRESRFFRLHMALEVEHVRLTVANFLRFCTNDLTKSYFLAGFDQGIHFWEGFWGDMAMLTQSLAQEKRAKIVVGGDL